jgi:hypothetical protein
MFAPNANVTIRVLVAGLALSLLAAAVAAVRNLLKAPASVVLRGLQEHVREADVALEELSSLELADLFERLGYSTSERISLYIPARDGSCLRLVARHALTDEYRKTKGAWVRPGLDT